MSITRKQMSESQAYPVGKYELEIKEFKHQSGTSEDGKPWEKALLTTEIISPDNLSGRKFTTGFFYDKKFIKLIEVGLGKSIDDIFDGSGPDAQIDQNKVKNLLVGEFFSCNLGINDKGYNLVAQILPQDKKSNEPV